LTKMCPAGLEPAI